MLNVSKRALVHTAWLFALAAGVAKPSMGFLHFGRNWILFLILESAKCILGGKVIRGNREYTAGEIHGGGGGL